jgi:hypothetical protein
MANVYDSIDIKGFRKAHINQLRSYIHGRDIEGWYYGNREQFENRHEELKKMDR